MTIYEGFEAHLPPGSKFENIIFDFASERLFSAPPSADGAYKTIHIWPYLCIKRNKNVEIQWQPCLRRDRSTLGTEGPTIVLFTVRTTSNFQLWSEPATLEYYRIALTEL